MRKLVSTLMVISVVLVLASPAHACSIDPNVYRIRAQDLAGLNQPDSALAANYQAWLDKEQPEGAELTPPAISGATLFEVVAATEETEIWSKGVVTLAVERWGIPPRRTDLSEGPVKFEDVIPGSCEGTPSGSVGHQFIMVRSDRGDARVRVLDESRKDLEAAFGTSTVTPVNPKRVEGKIRQYQELVDGSEDTESVSDRAEAPESAPSDNAEQSNGEALGSSALDSVDRTTGESGIATPLLGAVGAGVVLGAVGLLVVRSRSTGRDY